MRRSRKGVGRLKTVYRRRAAFPFGCSTAATLPTQERLRPVRALESSGHNKPTVVTEVGVAVQGVASHIHSVAYSTRYWELEPGRDRPSLEPDVLVPLSSAQYFAQQDPVLDEALRR